MSSFTTDFIWIISGIYIQNTFSFYLKVAIKQTFFQIITFYYKTYTQTGDTMYFPTGSEILGIYLVLQGLQQICV